ncbi:MAG: dual specificity protein phosphatase family protein [Desulfobacterales bacterium]|nr:dual specificity protein phosphatase family protein [Desulfobacterales bacterium]
MKSADEQKHSVPFKRSYWVVPGKLLAGCYPGAVDPKQAHQKLKRLLEHGIRRVISLMEPTEINWNGKAFESYEDRMKSIADDMGVEVFFDRMPIKDTWIPSRKEMCQILDRIDQSIADNQPVYVHCWGGRGRTGTVVGCYLARHRIASDQKALTLIQKLRIDTEDKDKSSPETSHQVDMVLSWMQRE